MVVVFKVFLAFVVMFLVLIDESVILIGVLVELYVINAKM